MQRTSAAALCLLAAAILVACTRNGPPNSLFESAGYHIRGGTVYYLNAFPGKAFEIDGADAATFTALDNTYGRDRSTVFVNGHRLPNADAASFELLGRPGFAKDRDHVYHRDHPISDDPAHFALLEGELAKDSHSVYWSDGSVLSDDPAHFAVISDADHYLFTKDGRTVHVNGNPIDDADAGTFQVLQGAYARDKNRVFYFHQAIADADPSSFQTLDGPYARDATHVYWMGKVIAGADPATFRVLNADFECSADAQRAYHQQSVIAGADPQTFPSDRPVTNCSATSISFAQ
ncbi:hypothetical protein A5662_21575 [Mycobacteriaceae bacterium 1482268.1]|nr:hypothetical protein A5662_21575 [Mycobacteriaceae bacterium 1482268.1]